MLPLNKLMLSLSSRSRYVSFNYKPSWCSWTILMAYCTAKLKSNGDKASSCSKLFLMGKMLQKCCLPGLSYRLHLVHISQSYQFHRDTKLSKNTLQDLLPNWIISSLQVYKELMHCLNVFPIFLKFLRTARNCCILHMPMNEWMNDEWMNERISWMHKTWSLVGLLCQNPH